MRTTSLAAAALLCMAAAPAWTVPPGADPVTGARPGNIIGTGNSLPLSDQASNITPFNTASPIAPRLPTPAVASDDPEQYLQAARQALAAHRTGEAQEALEEAEARLLDRSVPREQYRQPDDSPAIRRIRGALRALAAGDFAEAQRRIDRAEAAAAQPGETVDSGDSDLTASPISWTP